MDYDPESTVVLTYRVDATPTILFFKEGTLVDKVSGLVLRASLSGKIARLTNSVTKSINQ